MSKTDLAVYRRQGLVLVPCDPFARMQIASMAEGDRACFEKRNPRSMRQHKAYFAMLNNVVQASGEWPSRSALEFDIALALRAGDFHRDRFGNSHFRPWSRAVASMSKDDFERLHNDTVALLTDWLGCDPEMLREEAA